MNCLRLAPLALAALFIVPVLPAKDRTIKVGTTSLSVALDDGSLLHGTTRLTTLPLTTSYASLELPFSGLAECRVDPSTGKLTATMRNGDTLTGTSDLSALPLRSLVGKIHIDWSHIASVHITPQAPTGSTVLHYRFDEDSEGKVRDDSGQDHHGTAHQLTYVDTPFGRGVRTKGRDTFVCCDTLSLDGARQLTVSTWIKLERYTTYGRILNRGGKNESGGGGFGLAIGGSYGSRPMPALFGVALKGGERCTVKVPKFVKGGEWTHLVGTYNGLEVAYYANGKLIGKESVPTELRNLPIQEASNVDLFAGKCSTRRTWYDTHLNGVMDEIRIDTRAWSAKEIASHYENHQP